MIKVLMIGPSRTVKGGMTSVVNNYFEHKLNEKVNLKYLETINDKNKISKFIKEKTAIIKFKIIIKKYDIIHIHVASRRSTYRKIKYIKIAKKYNKKIILHIHGGGFKKFFEEECNQNQKNWIKENINKCEKIIVLSDEWKEYFSKLTSTEKLEVIYNGVNVPKIKRREINNNRILFLGRINKNKGIYDALECMNLLKKNNVDFEFIICGDGENKKLISEIKRLDLKENVKFKGWINNNQREKELSDSSYFILPSYFEAMPVSILEAMAYGNVVISTNVGSIPKIIKSNKNGILVNPGDIKQLYLSLKKVIENKKMAESLSMKSIETIKENFDIKNNIEKTLKLYKEVI